MTTVTHDDFSVSWTTGDGMGGGAELHVRRVRWTTDEELARRVGLYVSVRYRDAETGECVMSDDYSQPDGSVAEHSFMTRADHDGRWFPSFEEAKAFALERGYLQVHRTSPRLRAKRVARAERPGPFPEVTPAMARAASRGFAKALREENARASR